VACCAGPALIAGGALAAIGGFLSGGFAIGLAVLLLAVVVLLLAANRRNRSCAQRHGCSSSEADLGRRRHE
jgi:hypothetical protein